MKTTESGITETEMGNAAYIAGCLLQQDVIPVLREGKFNENTMEAAVRIIAACLRDLRHNPGDCPGLPFKW